MSIMTAGLWSRYKNPAVMGQVGRIFAGQFSNAFFGLITAVCLTRLLSVGEYGRYVYILQVLGFFAFLAMPGMTTAVLQGAVKGFDRVLASGIRRRLLFSLAGSAGIVMWTALRWPDIDGAMRVSLLCAAAAFPVYVCLSTYFYYLNGKRLYGTFAAFYFVQSAVICLASVAAGFYTRSFVATAAAAIAAKIAVDAVLLYITHRRYVRPDAADDPDALRVGWHLSLVSVIGCLGNNVDKLIVGTCISFEVLGLYAIADMIAGQLKVMNNIMDNYISPVMVGEGEQESKANLFGRTVRFTALSFILAAAGYIAVYALISVFFTAKYVHSLPYVGALLAINVLAAPGAVFSVHLRARKKLTEVYVLKVAESMALVLGYLALVHVYGIWGVIAALGLSNIAYSLTGAGLIYLPGLAERLDRSAFGRFVLNTFTVKKAEAST